MGGKIDMAARRRVTSKLQVQYRKAAKADKGEILDRWWPPRGGSFDGSACAIRPRPSDPADQIDGRRLRPRRFSDDARAHWSTYGR